MTDFGRRPGEMLKSIYDTDDNGVVDAAQTVIAHKTSHQDGGVDEISVAALFGELADEQPSAWTKVSGKPSTFDPTAHKTSHQGGGTDEINATGLVGRVNYVDRGDPSSVDWSVDDFTTDETWNDLDCSAIVPAGAQAIILKLGINNSQVSSAFSMRKNGNTNDIAGRVLITQVANITTAQNLTIPCDANRIIEYWATLSPFTIINLTVLGWLI